jgi:hypothetical protein
MDPIDEAIEIAHNTLTEAANDINGRYTPFCIAQEKNESQSSVVGYFQSPTTESRNRQRSLNGNCP